MVSSRVFIGQLSSRSTGDDLKELFRDYGKIIDVSLKNGYAFVEFQDERDAASAIKEMHGKELRGERIVVESAHGRSSRRSYESRPGGFGDRYRRDDFDQRNRSRYNAPRSTRHRMIVENLSTRYTWFDLKDMMNQYAQVTFADAHKTEQRVGLVCFASRSGLKRALEKCQGKEVNGRRIKLIDDSMGSPSRSRSRERRRSPGSRRSKSRSPGVSKGRRRSRSVSKSRSRASSRSLSRSPVQRAKKVKSPGSKSSYTSHGKSSSQSPPPKKRGKASSSSGSERDHSPVGKRIAHSDSGTS